MKVKCPKCQHVFESIEHPQPILEAPPETKVIGTSAQYMATPAFNLCVTDEKTQTSAMNAVMKKGFNGIIITCNTYNNGATYTEIAESENVNLSSATLSKRLKEGVDAGVLEYGIRGKNGKRVYKSKL